MLQHWAVQRQHPWPPGVAATHTQDLRPCACQVMCSLPGSPDGKNSTLFQATKGAQLASNLAFIQAMTGAQLTSSPRMFQALRRAHLHPEAETSQQQPVQGGIHERPRVLQHCGSLCQQQGMEGWQLLEGLPCRACSCGQQQLQLGPCWNVLRCCQGQPEQAQGLICQSPATQWGLRLTRSIEQQATQCR